MRRAEIIDCLRPVVTHKDLRGKRVSGNQREAGSGGREPNETSLT